VSDQAVKSLEVLRDPFAEWVASEGLPVTTGFGADLFEVETRDWSRIGVPAGIVNLTGRGDFASLIVTVLPPGASSEPQRHLYEEVVYVLSGHGTTAIHGPDGDHVFEWGPKSMFALPLNVDYRYFNVSGHEEARLASTTSLPLSMNVFRNDSFVFDNAFDFGERFGSARYFEGQGDLVPGPRSRLMWETNFVPDLSNFSELRPMDSRGAGGTNIAFVLADGSMHAHISEIPVGRYKKGHRHAESTHVFTVTGHGYSLFWYEGEKEFERVDWRHGVVFVPPDQMFHQHFNTSGEPARYFAVAFGSIRYPITAAQRFVFTNSERNVKEGGIQIEYEQQDPRIHRMYVEEMDKSGEPIDMDAFPVGMDT
jgi:uncharacterized RmlC-like cupin family protein